MFKAEMEGKYLSVVFDGTSRLGEVLAVVVRFISNWTIQQPLVRLQFLMKSMNDEEVARELISVLSVTLGVESHRLLAVMHDRASVNIYCCYEDCYHHVFHSVGCRAPESYAQHCWKKI